MTASRRTGFSLLEIMIAMFILALGLIMIAAAFPVALRQSADSQDLTMSSYVGRSGAARFTIDASPNLLRVFPAAGCNPSVASSDTSIHWYGPNTDQAANGGSYRWFRDDAAVWGQACPYPADDRYAYQIFYRRVALGTPPSPTPVGWPMLYKISVVVQRRGDGAFRPAMDATAMDAGNLSEGDMYCTATGLWRRFQGLADPVYNSAPRGFGVPGGIAVFETTTVLNNN